MRFIMDTYTFDFKLYIDGVPVYKSVKRSCSSLSAARMRAGLMLVGLCGYDGEGSVSVYDKNSTLVHFYARFK